MSRQAILSSERLDLAEMQNCRAGHGYRPCVKVKGEWTCLRRCLGQPQALIESTMMRLRGLGATPLPPETVPDAGSAAWLSLPPQEMSVGGKLLTVGGRGFIVPA